MPARDTQHTPMSPVPGPDHEPEYVLGTNEAEMQRLGFQHRLWSAQAQALWQRAGLRPGVKLLDIGCGPGFAAMEMAQLVTHTGSIVGVDESRAYVEFANQQARARALPQARFFRGDVTSIDGVLATQGVGPGSFDMAYARWVLCFVPDPEAVVRAAVKMLRPGGRLCVQDYFGYDSMRAAPMSDAFKAVIDAIDHSWRQRGGDPDIMGRLPGIAVSQGLRIEHLTRVEVGTARPGMPMWDWPESFWGVFLPRLEELGSITSAQREAFMRNWEALSRDPAAYMHLPPVYEMIAVKPEA